jgi:hypothetical protein
VGQSEFPWEGVGGLFLWEELIRNGEEGVWQPTVRSCIALLRELVPETREALMENCFPTQDLLRR